MGATVQQSRDRTAARSKQGYNGGIIRFPMPTMVILNSALPFSHPRKNCILLSATISYALLKAQSVSVLVVSVQPFYTHSVW